MYAYRPSWMQTHLDVYTLVGREYYILDGIGESRGGGVNSW